MRGLSNGLMRRKNLPDCEALHCGAGMALNAPCHRRGKQWRSSPHPYLRN